MTGHVRPGLRGRVDAWAVEQAWRRIVAEFTANGRILLVATLPLVVLALLSLLVLPRTFLTGAFVGLVVTAAIAFPVWVASMIHGARQLAAGGQVEDLTAIELARLDRRRWIVLDRRDLAGLEVDHVAIGGERVIAVATIWRREPARFAELARLAEVVAHDADRLTKRLAAGGARRRVVPVVVVWGPAAGSLAGSGRSHQRVRIVAGPELVERCQSQAASGPLDVAAFAALRDPR